MRMGIWAGLQRAMARLFNRNQAVHLPANASIRVRIMDDKVPLSSDDLMLKYRRMAAIVAFGEEGEDESCRSLLTTKEQENLEAFVIQGRWARFRAKRPAYRQ